MLRFQPSASGEGSNRSACVQGGGVMRLVYKLFMGIAGSLCALIMLVVGEPAVAALLAVCVLLVLLDAPERVGRLADRGGCRD